MSRKERPEIVRRVRELADAGMSMRRAGEVLGMNMWLVGYIARTQKIRFHAKRGRREAALPETPTDLLRKRWLELIGPMKERLRRDIAA